MILRPLSVNRSNILPPLAVDFAGVIVSNSSKMLL
jgi:hypothetical protein